MNCNPNCHCGLSAWEVRGAVAPSPADWLTCGSADTLTVRDRDCPRWLLRSGTYRARPDHPGLGGPSPARAARSRSSLPYHSKTGLVMALRSMSHFPIQETFFSAPGRLPRPARQPCRQLRGSQLLYRVNNQPDNMALRHPAIHIQGQKGRQVPVHRKVPVRHAPDLVPGDTLNR